MYQCSLSLTNVIGRHTVEDLNEHILSILRSWISPTEIASDDYVCSECLTLLQNRITQSDTDLSLAFGHKNVCFGCGMSIAHRRDHSLDCPERNIVLRWTPVHQVFHLEKICIACWLEAKREVHAPITFQY